ncbi:MAG: FtsX-like permease family protein [Curtobacterium sp.]
MTPSRHRDEPRPRPTRRRARVPAPGRPRLGADRATVGVAALSAGLGTLVVTGSAAAERVVELGERTGASGTVALILPVVAWVFIGIALYVSAVVASNTCATVIAGRTRSLALQRVLGATGEQLRSQIARSGLAAGLVGSVLGAVLGVLVANGALTLAAAASVLPEVGLFLPVAVVPVTVLVATITTAAYRLGSRAVLSIPPLRALDAATEESVPEGPAARARWLVAAAVFVLGAAGIGVAIVLGATSVSALLLAVVAGAVSFTGVVIGTPVLVPAAIRLVAGAASRGVIGAMAARNSMRSPRRTARATVGLLIAVTLMVTFAVGFTTYARMLRLQSEADPVYYRGIEEQFDQLAVLFASLTGAAGVIAAAGVVVVTALTIAQRTRELGLLRVTGTSRRQVRALVLTETAMTIAVAVVLGVLLGTAYGWSGAYTLLGATPEAQLIAPVVPAWVLVTVGIGAVVTGLTAAVGPAARAVCSAPVAALQYE